MGSPSAAQGAHLTTTTLRVEGITCGSCTSSVEAGFQGVEGVGSVSVSLAMDRAVIIHDAEKISAEQIRDTIEDRGFDATVLHSDAPHTTIFDVSEEEDGETDELLILESGISTTTLHVGGMTCGACTSAVEGAFKDMAGIKSFSISLLSERAVIEHDANLVSSEKLAEVIEDTGFDAEVLETKAADHKPSQAKTVSKKGTSKNLITTTVAIEGMTCGACTAAVEGGFKETVGLVQFNISLLAERAVIVHDLDKLTAAQIVETIEDCGFDATIISSEEQGAQISASTVGIQLKIYGLPSPEAAADLQALLSNISGIVSANVNSITTRATITHTPTLIGLRAIVEAIENVGYNALVADSDDNNAQLESLAKTKEIREWYRAFRVSLSFAIPVFLVSMFVPMFLPFLDIGKMNFAGIWLGDIVCLVLTIPVQFGIGKRFYVSAFRSIRHGSPTMDVLVVLGTSAAFFFSCAAMLVSFLTPPHSRPATVFDTSTMLITFIVLGRFLENRAKGQTSKALSRLMNLAPSSATIYADPIAATKAAEGWDKETFKDEKSGKKDVSGSAIEERNVPTELIEVGDVVILKPGDKIPADGTVTRGESFVDESMVTGEAMPILKKKGANLMAGTVNGAGRVDMRVTRAGRDTQLSQIVRLVQEAQTSRAPIQRVADTVAGYFVPIIITLGLSTFVAWMVLSHVMPHPPGIFMNDSSGGKLMVCVKLCIAVVVFACPCALGLATPTAVMVGTGVGAEQGILVKGGAALETATKITHVVLDKTGTLTMGKMSVSNSTLANFWNTSLERTQMWWKIVGLAEGNSEHPIAKAILAGAKERLGLGVDGTIEGNVGDFVATVGNGIAATVELNSHVNPMRHEAVIGNTSFLQNRGIAVPSTPEDEYSDLTSTTGPSSSKSSQHAGVTTIHVAIDNAYAGTIALSDTLKPSARACISALHAMGIRTSLVTGDQLPTAQHVASLVGIPPDNIFAAVLPSGKRTIVEELQAQGEVVAMVGDGINDSPALATANVGISLASGTDVAMEAADIVLMKAEQLLDIPASLHLSRTIFRRIKYNLLLSCVYNAVGLPIAMGFLLPWGITLPPLAAGAAMACSSVTVVGSSLLLKTWRRPKWMLAEDLGASTINGYAGKGWRGHIGSLAGMLTGSRRGKETAASQRGAYVPLDDIEAV
nr:putative copper-transporting atpase hma5 [Quercus suber]